MIEIKKNTNMLLFRFRDYYKTDFIEEHMSILRQEGHVWMLKVGKKTSEAKIRRVLDDGGWLVLRSPKSNGSKMYLARFTCVQPNEPDDMIYPPYYSDLLSQNEDDEYYSDHTVYQWFMLTSIVALPNSSISALQLATNQSPVSEVINTTRTAVMFVTNTETILV